MKKRIICIMLVVLVTVVAIGSAKLYSEPDRCPLCDCIKSHAPCLVNLATGEVEEMALYDPHHTLVGEIAEEQKDSTFSFVDVAGARGTRLSSPWIMELDVPATKAPVLKKHFCRECRKLLAGQSGYVIADLYTPGEPRIISIADGMQVSMRCYEITAVRNDDGIYELTVRGTYGN